MRRWARTRVAPSASLASACGVTGLKPTQTRVSRAGVMPLSFSHDNVGPLTRTVRDCARVMTVIAGHDPLDPTSATEPVPDYEAALDGDIRGLRVGVPSTYFLEGADDAVVAALEAAVAVLEARGAVVVRMTLPLMDAVSGYGGIISRVEGATIHARWMRDRPQDYAVHLSARMYGGNAIPGTYYVEALSRRGPVLRAFSQEVFAQRWTFWPRRRSRRSCRPWPQPTSTTGRPARNIGSWRCPPTRARSITWACQRSACPAGSTRMAARSGCKSRDVPLRRLW